MEAKAPILLLLLCIYFLVQTGESASQSPPNPLAKRKTFTFPFPFTIPGFQFPPPTPGTPPVSGGGPFPFPFPKPGTPPVSGGGPFPFPFPGSPSEPLNQEAKACLADFHGILRSSKSKHSAADLDVTYALCHTIKALRPKCWPVLFPYASTLPPSLLADCAALSPAPGPSPINSPNLASF